MDVSSVPINSNHPEAGDYGVSPSGQVCYTMHNNPRGDYNSMSNTLDATPDLLHRSYPPAPVPQEVQRFVAPPESGAHCQLHCCRKSFSDRSRAPSVASNFSPCQEVAPEQNSFVFNERPASNSELISIPYRGFSGAYHRPETYPEPGNSSQQSSGSIPQPNSAEFQTPAQVVNQPTEIPAYGLDREPHTHGVKSFRDQQPEAFQYPPAHSSPPNTCPDINYSRVQKSSMHCQEMKPTTYFPQSNFKPKEKFESDAMREDTEPYTNNYNTQVLQKHSPDRFCRAEEPFMVPGNVTPETEFINNQKSEPLSHLTFHEKQLVSSAVKKAASNMSCIKMFQDKDKWKSGKIGRTDFQIIMDRIGVLNAMSSREIDAVFKGYSTHSDTVLDYKRFAAACKQAFDSDHRLARTAQK